MHYDRRLPPFAPDCLDHWRRDTAACVDYGALLDDLTFWRLSDDGDVVQQVRP